MGWQGLAHHQLDKQKKKKRGGKGKEGKFASQYQKNVVHGAAAKEKSRETGKMGKMGQGCLGRRQQSVEKSSKT